jgi:hypothetical protein
MTGPKWRAELDKQTLGINMKKIEKRKDTNNTNKNTHNNSDS